MKYLILLFTMFSIFTNNNFIASAKIIEYDINATTHEELLEKSKTYSYDLLNELSTEFTVVLTGEYIESLIFDDVTSTQTDFEAPLILSYINGEINSYNSLLLRKYTISKTVYKSNIFNNKTKKIKLNYLITWGEQPFQKNNVYNFAKVISDNILFGITDDYTKILTIHNYILDNYSYDTINTNDTYIHTPNEMINKGYGVCSAYTGLMSAFLDVNNIPNRAVLKDAFSKGDDISSQAHAWNLVKIDNAWYHIDATWDDPISLVPSLKHSLKYFLISDEQIGKDHIWDKSVYPTSDSSYKESAKKQVLAPVSNIAYEPLENETNVTSLSDFGSKLLFGKLFNILLNINFIIGAAGVISLIFLFISSTSLLKR